MKITTQVVSLWFSSLTSYKIVIYVRVYCSTATGNFIGFDLVKGHWTKEIFGFFFNRLATNMFKKIELHRNQSIFNSLAIYPSTSPLKYFFSALFMKIDSFLVLNFKCKPPTHDYISDPDLLWKLSLGLNPVPQNIPQNSFFRPR